MSYKSESLSIQLPKTFNFTKDSNQKCTARRAKMSWFNDTKSGLCNFSNVNMKLDLLSSIMCHSITRTYRGEGSIYNIVTALKIEHLKYWGHMTLKFPSMRITNWYLLLNKNGTINSYSSSRCGTWDVKVQKNCFSLGIALNYI